MKEIERNEFDAQTDKLVQLLSYVRFANYVTRKNIWYEYSPHVDAISLSYYKADEICSGDLVLEIFYINEDFGNNLDDAFAFVKAFINEFGEGVDDD